MSVASGQLPYQYEAVLPLRTRRGAWPGIFVPNIGPSGDLFEDAMFVYNAELRKWNFPDQLDLLQYSLYTHPDVAASGFEPKPNGDTLIGKVGGRRGLITSDNIEHLRLQLQTFLFDAYADDTDYGERDLMESWLTTAYPESTSGNLRIRAGALPGSYFTFGVEFLRPPIEAITGGDFINTLDLHWLCGSGVLFDIDVGEVIFNPFPFPGQSFRFAPSTQNMTFDFGPLYPIVQTTLGTLPSVLPSRYATDIGQGSFKQQTNFNAIASGFVQIDGYVLLPNSTMELVRGNDNNFDATVVYTNDYTGHVQGVRRVAVGAGEIDNSARCYRLPTPQSSGLYRFLVHNQKVNVPFTAISSGFVSLWPPGRVIAANDGNVNIVENRIHGRELTVTSDGGLQRDARDTTGVHVTDDAIWMTGPNATGSGSIHSRGLYIVSPYNGTFVWYRPAERTIATSGNIGGAPGHFGVHLGLVDFGTSFLRISKVLNQILTTDIGTPTPNSDQLDNSVFFQEYDKTTLDHSETQVDYTIIGEDAIVAGVGSEGFTFCFGDGGDIWIGAEFGAVHRFTGGLSFVNAYRGPIARRRYFAGGKYLYTIGDNVQVGDPLIGVGLSTASGIGEWTFADPAGGADGVGTITHIAGKLLRGETHFGLQSAIRTEIHHIFDVAGSTHVADGVWAIIRFDNVLWLVRIVEEATHWQVVESMRLTRTPISGLGLQTDFPYEGVLHDID